MRPTLLITSLVLLLSSSILYGHGDVHEQIEDLSRHIEEDPGNAGLYLKRGQLFARHEEFEKAVKDYGTARDLNADLTITDLLLAKVFAQKGEPRKALEYANAFLENHEADANGLITRAGIFQQLHDETNARQDLEAAMSNLEHPSPAHYIAIAEAFHTNGDQALYWLEMGQKRFGFDIVLKEKEIEILVARMQYDRALTAIDQVMNQLPRKEKWLFEKGQVCEKANRGEEALAYYQETLIAIESLPDRIKMTRKMLELEVNVAERIRAVSR